MEWTPEAIKAEIDYRQTALRSEAAHSRLARLSSGPKRSWWRRLGHRPSPEIPVQRNAHHDAA